MRAVIRVICLVGLAAVLGRGTALAGPIIIDGTDANDHGFCTGGPPCTANQDGWRYMQAALTNLAAALGGGATKTVTALGITNAGGQSGVESWDAYFNAFALSGLPGAGWSTSYVDGAANVATALTNLSTASTGILYIDTYGLDAGDLDTTEMANINANATKIRDFVNAGGALFAMGESTSGGPGAWGWLQTLLPGLLFTDLTDAGANTELNLTAAGAAAFPGLPNSEVQVAIPWHNYFFGNLGSLQVLATGALAGEREQRAVILGGGAGSVIGPSVPEPTTLLLFGTGLAGLYRRRMKKTKA